MRAGKDDRDATKIVENFFAFSLTGIVHRPSASLGSSFVSQLTAMPPCGQPKRTIHVAAGKAHKRTINAPADPNQAPIVERMTRSRLEKMTDEEEEAWKTESVNAILNTTTRKSDQESILKFLNTPSTSVGQARRTAVAIPTRRRRR